MKYTPYTYQKEAITSVIAYFKAGKKGNPLVVAPTGSGKSVIIAEFCRQVVDKWPDQKIVIVSHVTEILKQNFQAIKGQCPGKNIGLYSASLKNKRTGQITIAGIQSIYQKPIKANIYIVDEAHGINHNKNSMYRKFFEKIKKPVIGFTATPFRMKSGYLHIGEDSFFDEIVYNIEIKTLQKQKKLCVLKTKSSKNKLETKKLKTASGDFIIADMASKFNRETVTTPIINELLQYKENRKKWLIFAIDIDHAKHLNEALINNGINSLCLHSKSTNKKLIIDKFKKQSKIQCLVSVAMLTTGFDAPNVDLIGIIRPTKSPSLHIQIIGRGLRVAPEKKDCLILDFAGNLLRNGPIDKPVIIERGKKEKKGTPILKECPQCFEISHISIKHCPECDHEFQFKHNLRTSPLSAEVVSRDVWHNIEKVKYYFKISRKTDIPMMLVKYYTANNILPIATECICPEHGGYASQKAAIWWENRSSLPMPVTASNMIEVAEKALKKPKRILVDESQEYSKIIDREF